jgi:RimJ/RimL family protein N-acetyltransferase
MKNQIYLNKLTKNDATQEYVDWMNSHEINQYLESRFVEHTIKSISDFIDIINSGNSSVLFGIFLSENSKHIGNIKIGNINDYHKYADMGLIIGDTNHHGKGYGTEAIKEATKYAIKQLDLNSITAGMYAQNKGSYYAFKKAGYSICGTYKNRWLVDDEYYDGYELEFVKNINKG